ncbi:Uncharacterised protein [Enterobacter hormaechei]|nr:Uncharacterised protein [Enterobacter hormaechei]
MVNQRYDRLPGQQLLTPGGQIHFSCPPPCGVSLPVPIDTVLNQGHFIQVREERKIKRQREVRTVEPDIADNVSTVPFIIVHFLYRQRHALGCQQLTHDPCDKPVFNVIAIVAEGDGLQSGRFFTAYWLRMVPARKQAIGREPPGLVLLFSVINQVSGSQNMADPLADVVIRPAMAAAVKKQIVATLFQATLERLFAGCWPFQRQACAQLFVEIR